MEKKKKSMAPKPDSDTASDILSDDEVLKMSNQEREPSPEKASRVVTSDEGGQDADDDDGGNDRPKSKRSSSKDSRRSSKKKDQEPSVPRRGRNSRDEEDAENSASESRKLRASSGGSDRSSGKPKRRSTKSEVLGGSGKDGEEPSQRKTRSTSKGRRMKAPNSSGSSSRRRRVKEKTIDVSGHTDSTGDDDDISFGEEEHEVELKDSDEGRRAVIKRSILAPGSAGRRTGRRTQTSSERWKRAVELEDEEGEARKELSRSGHAPRRHPSGSARTPNRRPTRRAMQTPNSDESGDGSFGDDDYEYEINLSARSARTLDSIEDLEDFEHIDFQTPGMANYDEEIMELMQKANPEHTSHLNRRVQRRREAVNYDQNMPMMTRQALMTRTASTQVQRQFVDQSNLDKRRMLVRNFSNSSMSQDELSSSLHRQQVPRAPPSRRPPPRTRSSGMAALSRSEHPTQDRRQNFRTKASGSASSSFHKNVKPNRVQSISRRGDADAGRTIRSAPEDRKGSLGRAQSMHAAVGRRLSPKKPERRVSKKLEPKMKEEDAKEEVYISDEDSDVDDSEDDGLAIASPLRTRKISPLKVALKPVLPTRKKTDKRDFTVKRNRAKLHSMLYESKMAVDMTDLLETVRQGEIKRSPWKSLVMPSP